MAQAAKTKGKAKKKPASTDLGAKAVFAVMAFAAIAVASPLTAMVALFGMLPAISAFLVSRTGDKTAALAVAGMNLAGVFPFLPDVWHHGSLATGGTSSALFPMTAMYGAAAFGWLLSAILPAVADALYNAEFKGRCSELAEKQETLVEEWGEDVTRLAPDNESAPTAH